MTDGSETRYTPQIRAEIERRWQDVPRWDYNRSSYGIHFEGTPRGYCPGEQQWRAWLEIMGCAQDDIQILLEGLATQERSLLAATARIAEVDEATELSETAVSLAESGRLLMREAAKKAKGEG